jgi:hypothetical protein
VARIAPIQWIARRRRCSRSSTCAAPHSFPRSTSPILNTVRAGQYVVLGPPLKVIIKPIPPLAAIIAGNLFAVIFEIGSTVVIAIRAITRNASPKVCTSSKLRLAPILERRLNGLNRRRCRWHRLTTTGVGRNWLWSHAQLMRPDDPVG